MFNVYVVKKWSALLLAGTLTTTAFATVSMFYGWLWGIVVYLATLLLAIFLGNILLKNPFTQMIEGKGILVLDLNSTGIIRPFIVSVAQPFIYGKLDGKIVKDVFDRETIAQLATTEGNSGTYEFKDGKMRLELTEEMYNKGKFALNHYPVIIWNSQIKSFLTKDFLAEQEKSIFAEHTVLYLNRTMDELTSLVRDFARYIVELTKPQGNILGKWWVWLIIVIFGGVMVFMFGPAILDAVKGSADTATSTISNAGTSIITPR